MRTVWVTGAAGFTGRFMIGHLRQNPEQVHIVGVDVQRPASHQADLFLVADVCDKSSVLGAVTTAPPDVVIHLAGLMPPHTEADMRRVNVQGSINLVRALSHHGARTRLISAGSAAEYLPDNQPLTETSPIGGNSPYGRTKCEQSAALLAAQVKRLEVIIARPFNLLGPGLSSQLVAGALCEQFATTGRQEGYITPRGSLKAVRDFIDVRDVVAAYWLLADKGNKGEIYNVCSAAGTPIATVVDLLQMAFGKAVEIRQNTEAANARDDVFVGDNRKLAVLGWRPIISVEQSLRDMVQFVNSPGPGAA